MSAALFQQFRKNISVQNADAISKSYGQITTRLNKDFWATESDTSHSLQVGSYGRHTAIDGISDLDMVFELPNELLERYKNYQGNGASQLLQSVRDSLLDRYPRTKIKGDGQVVVVEFDAFRVEVLPAFWQAADRSYIHANTHDGGSWPKSYPRQEIEAINTRNTASNRNLKHACKMIRAWKNTHGVNISGILIDTLCHNFFGQTEKYNDKSYATFDELSVDLFSYLASLPNQDYWLTPGSNQRAYSKGNFQRKAKRAATNCQQALDSEKTNRRARLWRQVYGRSFPLEIVVVEAVTAAAKSEAGYGTEDFIEDKFPVDIRYDLDLDCEVAEQQSKRNLGALRQLSKIFPWLPAGRELRFFVKACNVPEPYAILWKVRNVGPVAERKRMIRGEIVSDMGYKQRIEHTSFSGEHFVECYAIKGGVCVARDLIDVPINIPE